MVNIIWNFAEDPRFPLPRPRFSRKPKNIIEQRKQQRAENVLIS